LALEVHLAHDQRGRMGGYKRRATICLTFYNILDPGWNFGCQDASVEAQWQALGASEGRRKFPKWIKR
jgi:hypothetical protein